MCKECGCSSEDKKETCEVCGKPADECTCDDKGEEKGVEGE